MEFNVHKDRLDARLGAGSEGLLARKGLAALSAVPLVREMTGRDRFQHCDYGYCRICGADISAEHLQAHPNSPHCESCAG